MKKYEYLINGKPFVVEILSFDGHRGDVRVNNIAYSVEVPRGSAAGEPVRMPPAPAAPSPVPTAPPVAPSPTTPAAAPTPPPAVPASPASPQASSDSLVVAPMPGIILSLLVQEGDVVSAGDAVLVLEAMKMENEIHAPRAGKIIKVHVKEGAEVRAGEELFELE